MGAEMIGSVKSAPDKRITTGAWVLFFVMWGATLLVEQLLQVNLLDLQYVAAGLILLGMNGARVLNGIPMSRLTLVVGLLAITGGGLQLAMGEQPSIVAIVLGAVVSLLLAEGILRLQTMLVSSKVQTVLGSSKVQRNASHRRAGSKGRSGRQNG